jgi:hypothetical protein
MGQTSNQIERHIVDTRNDLGENLSELEERAKKAIDWRAQVDERPWTMIAVAFGGGVLLSALLPSARSSRRKYPNDRWISSPDRDAVSSITTPSAERGRTAETLEALKGALTGAALTKVSSFIEEVLPGFKQEFARTRATRGLHRSDSISGLSAQQKSAAAQAD